MLEIWKESKFKGYYVSSLGRVKNSIGHIMSIIQNKQTGYNYVSLQVDGKQPTAYGYKWKYKYEH